MDHAKHPTDDQILAAIDQHGGSAMTYVIRNILSREYGMTSTAFIRRRLMAMKKAGRVEQAWTAYAVQLCWKRKEPRHD